MKALMAYREKLVERLRAASREFCAACKAVQDPFAAVEDGGWNVHQLAAHTRDVDKQVYGLRARRTACAENPEFENFDADEWMARNYDAAESLDSILNEFAASVEELAAFLAGLPAEAWSRESRHKMLGGGFTMQIWVERGLAHIEEHLAAVRKVFERR